MSFYTEHPFIFNNLKEIIIFYAFKKHLNYVFFDIDLIIGLLFLILIQFNHADLKYLSFSFFEYIYTLRHPPQNYIF